MSKSKTQEEFDFRPATLGDEEEEQAQIAALARKTALDGRGQWRIEESEPVQFLKGHKGAPTCVLAHPEDATKGVFTGGKDCCIISWNIKDGTKNCIFEGRRKDPSCKGHTGAVTGLAALWDLDLLVSCGEDGKILLWNMKEAGEPIQTICITVETFTSMSLVPPNPEEDADDAIPMVIVGTIKGDLQVWMIHLEDAEEIEQRKKMWNYFKGHVGRINNLAMSCGSFDRVVSVSDDKTTRYHNLTKDSHLLFDRHNAPIEACAQLTPAVVASGDTTGQLFLWSTSSRKPIAEQSNLFNATVPEHQMITALYAPHGGSHTLFCGGPSGAISVVQSTQLKGRSCDIEITQSMHLDTSKDKSNIMSESGKGLGTVNSFCTSMSDSTKTGSLIVAMGRDQRLGRWCVEKGAKDGIAILKIIKIEDGPLE